MTPTAPLKITAETVDDAPRKVVRRDGPRTRQRILANAAKEFAGKGYDGARIEAIVKRSKVSKTLIYHYFASKDALFTAVLEAAYERMRERQDALGLQSLSAIDGVRRLIVETFRYWSEATDFIGFLSSENFHKGRHLKKSPAILQGYPGLIESLGQLLAKGQAEGVFRQNVDPVDLYVSISALGYHYLANRYTFSTIFGRDFTASAMLEQRLRHIEDVILGFLQYHPDQRTASS